MDVKVTAKLCRKCTIEIHCYRSQRSWGKVIFSEACVKNSAHRGGMRGRGVVHGGGAYIVGGMHGRGHAWQGGMCGGGHTWQGGGMHGRGGRAWQGGVRGRYYEIRSMSGRYASYWNAFLLVMLTHR